MYAGGDDTPTGDNTGEILSAAADMKFSDFAFTLAYQDIDTTGTAIKVVRLHLRKNKTGDSCRKH